MSDAIISVLAQADHAAQATAATTETFVVGEAQYDAEVTEATLIPSGPLTADNTNYRTFTLQNKGGDGLASRVIATLVTNTAGGNWVAGDEKKMTVTTQALDKVIVSNDVFVVVETVDGAGVAHPNIQVTVKGKRR